VREGYPDVNWSYNLRLRITDFEPRVLNVGVGPGIEFSGVARQLPYFEFGRLDHIDVHPPYLYKAQEVNWASKIVTYKIMDVRNIQNFDDWTLVLMFDVLEHLPEEDAIIVLNRLIASTCKILIFLPIETGEYQNKYPEVAAMEHRSFWKPEEFTNLGLNVEYLPKWNNGVFEIDVAWISKKEDKK